MTIARVVAPDLSVTATGVADLLLMEGLGFSADGARLLVKASYYDAAAGQGVGHAVWVYDASSGVYGDCLNAVIGGSIAAARTVDVKSAQIVGSGAGAVIVAEAKIGSSGEYGLYLIRNSQAADALAGALGAGASAGVERYALSADARFLAIQTSSAQFAPAATPDTNDASDIYLLDLKNGQVNWVTLLGGAVIDHPAYLGNVASDGQNVSVSLVSAVAFAKTDKNAVTSDDLSAAMDAYVWKSAYGDNGLTGAAAFTLASRTSTGASGFVDEETPFAVTSGGVYFNATASDLVQGDQNGLADAFLAGTTSVRLVEPAASPLASGAQFVSASTDGDMAAVLTSSGDVPLLYVGKQSTGVWRQIASGDVFNAADGVVEAVLSPGGEKVAFTSLPTAPGVALTSSGDLFIASLYAGLTISSASSAQVVENAPRASAVYVVSATSPDASGPLAYSIAGGADAALFAIDGSTGAVTFAASPDYEAPHDAGSDNVYNIVVRASDGARSVDLPVSISVANVNEAPTITSGGAAVTPENVSASTPVYTVLANDPDVGSKLVYSIAGGADAALFNINASTGAVSFAAPPDYEAPKDAGGDNVYNITVRASDGLLWSDRAVAVTVSNLADGLKLARDFNGDGNSDILLQNVNDGACFVWNQNNKSLVDFGFVGWAAGAVWQAKATGDFNGDGQTDILLQNQTDGACFVWNLNDKSLVDYGFVGWAPGVAWQVKATGDFNGDGKSDILLQNANDGACFVWNVNDKTLADFGFVGWAAGVAWQVKATADFNGDGRSDILLQNASDGACFVWEVDDHTLVDYGFVGWAPGVAWQVKGAGDFNGDGKSDILLQNANDGACFVWNLNDKTLVDYGFIGWAAGADWHVVA